MRFYLSSYAFVIYSIIVLTLILQSVRGKVNDTSSLEGEDESRIELITNDTVGLVIEEEMGEDAWNDVNENVKRIESEITKYGQDAKNQTDKVIKDISLWLEENYMNIVVIVSSVILLMIAFIVVCMCFCPCCLCSCLRSCTCLTCRPSNTVSI